MDPIIIAGIVELANLRAQDETLYKQAKINVQLDL